MILNPFPIHYPYIKIGWLIALCTMIVQFLGGEKELFMILTVGPFSLAMDHKEALAPEPWSLECPSPRTLVPELP